MPPKWTNRLPLRSADGHVCAETIQRSISLDIASLVSQITPGSVTGRVLTEVEIERDSEQGNRIINDAEDPLPEDDSNLDNDTPEPTQSVHNNDQPTAPSKINLEAMVERQ